MSFVMPIALTLWGAAIAGSDWRSLRIPNAWLLLLLVPALLAQFWTGHGLLGAGTGDALGGLLFAGGLALPGYLARQLGAGDVKLAAVLGFLAGFSHSQWLLVAGLLTGALALLMLARHGRGVMKQKRVPAGIALVMGFVAVRVWAQAWGGWAM
jgi:Type IV leader peptidase family.